VLFPNVWTLSHLQRTYLLSFCSASVLPSECDTNIYLVFSGLTSRPTSLLASNIHFLVLRLCQVIRPDPRLCVVLHYKKLIFMVGGLLAPCPTPKLKYHPLSAVHGCLFNIFAATLHIWRPSSLSTTQGCAMPCWRWTHSTWVLMPLVFKMAMVLHNRGVGVLWFLKKESVTACNVQFAHNFTWNHPAEYPFMPGTGYVSRKVHLQRQDSWSVLCVWFNCGPSLDLLPMQPTKINTPSMSWVAATTNNCLQNPACLLLEL
jgi:hypothetical protein